MHPWRRGLTAGLLCVSLSLAGARAQSVNLLRNPTFTQGGGQTVTDWLFSTWDWLKSRRLDAAILDCTHGGDPVARNHMGVSTVVKTREKLLAMGCLAEETPVIATHFSHNGGMLHEELENALRPHGILTAYDGMVLNLADTPGQGACMAGMVSSVMASSHADSR